MTIDVCRRTEDTDKSWTGDRTECDTCGKRVITEDPETTPHRCIHCAVITNPDLVMFVELPPDEYGHRSMAKGLKEIYEAHDGQWHKDGVWHNQKWVLDRQE